MLGLAPPPPEGNRFHALISYSHAADVPLATALQTGLQRFARPWYRMRALHVFRDNASLAANPHLWASVQAGLDASAHFILLASPDAAASAWVGRECTYWRDTKSCDQLLIVLTDGEIAWDEGANDFDWARTTAIPPALRGAFEGEPRWIDMRWARGEPDLSLADLRFKEAIAEIAAPLHGVPKDELESAEVRERRRAVRLARAAVVALALLTAAAVIAAVLALRARDEANHEGDIALSRALAGEARDALGGASGSLISARPDLGILLALEAYRFAPTEEARGALISALEATDHVAGYLHASGGAILADAYSPNGRTLAIATAAGGVELWNAASPVKPEVLRLPPGLGVQNSGTLAFSPDGRLLALSGVVPPGGLPGVVVWRLATARPVGPELTFGSQVFPDVVAFGPDGDLVVGASDGGVSEWVPGRTDGPLRTLPIRCPPGTLRVAAVTSIAVSADGTYAVGCISGAALIWRATYSAPATVAPPAGATYAHVALSRDGTTVAVGTNGQGELTLWAVRADGIGLIAGPRSLGDTYLDGLAFAPGGAMVAAAYGDGQTRVWARTGTLPVSSNSSTAAELDAIAWSPDGHTIAVGGAEGVGVLWQAPATPQAGSPSLLATVLDGGVQGAGTVAFDPGGRFMASVEPDGVHLWLPASGRPIGRPIAGSASPPLFTDSASARLVVGPGGVLAATRITASGRIVVATWNASDPRSPRPLGAPLQTAATAVTAMAINPAGTVLAVAVEPNGSYRSSDLELWKLRGRSMRIVPMASLPTALAFSPDGRQLVIGDFVGGIELMHYRSRRLATRVLVPDGAGSDDVYNLTYSPDGSTLAVNSAGVKLIDAGSGAEIGGPLVGNTSGAGFAVAFSPDGRLLAVGSVGGVQLIDVATEEPFGGELPVAGGADSVAFSPDGGLLAAAGGGPVTLWNRLLWTGGGQYAARVARLCTIVGRNLSAAEWNTYAPGRPYHRTCPRWP